MDFAFSCSYVCLIGSERFCHNVGNGLKRLFTLISLVFSFVYFPFSFLHSYQQSPNHLTNHSCHFPHTIVLDFWKKSIFEKIPVFYPDKSNFIHPSMDFFKILDFCQPCLVHQLPKFWASLDRTCEQIAQACICALLDTNFIFLFGYNIRGKKRKDSILTNSGCYVGVYSYTKVSPILMSP